MTRWYPELAKQVLKGIEARTQPSLSLFLEGAGHLPDWDVILMQTAYCLEPTRLSPGLLIDRIPYTRPGSFFERMQAAVRRGWLYEEDRRFGLTDEGREIVEGLYELGYRLCTKIDALTGPEMECLRSLSDEVINKIKRLFEPPSKPAFELSLHFNRDGAAPPILQVCQRILVVLAFREDAHMAAWRPFESDGQLWETFTLIWREQACSATEIARQLQHRNYKESDYVVALEKLTSRGWIKDRGGGYIVREQAAQMRQKVEDTADRIFAAAFADLSLTEMDELQELMASLAEKVVLPKKDMN